MIGGAVLVVGLLLILAGLASARIPGEATFASSGISLAPGTGTGDSGPLGLARRARDPIRAFVLSPIHPATWYANAAILLGFFVGVFAFAFLVSIASAGFATFVAGVGFVLIGVAIEGSRRVARIERRRVSFGSEDLLFAHPYRPLRGGGIGGFLRALFADENRWRDVLYVAINLPLSILEFSFVASIWGLCLWLLTMPLWYDAVPGATLPGFLGALSGHDLAVVVVRTLIGALLLPVAASIAQLVLSLHRAVVSGLLCTSESRELRKQVETLKESRSAVLDVEATELHRIERDLHDGAQQRLVMMTIDLGLASERIDSDPQAAKQLILEGQAQAREALAELRDLVRGIAPSILLDRGLVAAIGSITARGPVPTSVRSELPPGERLPAAVERAAYFVAAEALANVAKHSAASHCEVRCRREGSSLVVEVWDDGVGGAATAPGGGLAGLAGRVTGVDGTFSVSSPAGGPTLVQATFPVATWTVPMTA